MVKYVGHLMIGMGLVHGVVSFILFGENLQEIWIAGPGAGLEWSPGMLAGFWFFIFTWLMIALGVIMVECYKRIGDIPGRRSVGASFILVPIVLGIFLPVSGLWVFLLPGVILLFGKP